MLWLCFTNPPSLCPTLSGAQGFNLLKVFYIQTQLTMEKVLGVEKACYSYLSLPLFLTPAQLSSRFVLHG